MVISTGTIRPSLACACVCALNSLQKAMVLTPCWPRAGPTGGEGFALPAGSCSLTTPVIFFATVFSYRWSSRLSSPTAEARGPRPEARGLRLFHLHEVQLDRRGTAED